MTRFLQVLQDHWKLAAVIGLFLVLLSIALLVFTLSPAGETARLQATLAPTLFVPPGGSP